MGGTQESGFLALLDLIYKKKNSMNLSLVRQMMITKVLLPADVFDELDPEHIALEVSSDK